MFDHDLPVFVAVFLNTSSLLVPSLIAFLSGWSRKYGTTQLLPHQVFLDCTHYTFQRGQRAFPENLPQPSQTYSMNVKRVVAQGQPEVAAVEQIGAQCLLELTSRGPSPGSHSIAASGPFTCLRLKWKGSSLKPPRGHLLAKGFARERVRKKLWFEQCFAP